VGRRVLACGPGTKARQRGAATASIVANGAHRHDTALDRTTAAPTGELSSIDMRVENRELYTARRDPEIPVNGSSARCSAEVYDMCSPAQGRPASPRSSAGVACGIAARVHARPRRGLPTWACCTRRVDEEMEKKSQVYRRWTLATIR